MKKMFKKSLAVIMVVVLTLTTAPLSGFVGFDLPDFGFKAAAEQSTYYVEYSGVEYSVPCIWSFSNVEFPQDKIIAVTGPVAVEQIIDKYASNVVIQSSIEVPDCGKTIP